MSVVPRPAATVVVLDASGRVLLMRRRRELQFFGGAFAFPGGKCEPEDALPPAALGLSPAVAAGLLGRLDATYGGAVGESEGLGFYLAACRELFEEVGLLLADGAVDEAERQRLRADLASGKSFVGLLAAIGARPRLEALTYYAHWVTPSFEPKRYDTRFFVTRAPEGQALSADSSESVELRWLAPAAALELEQKGELVLPPPTQCTLAELAVLGSPEAIVAAAGARPVVPWMPKVVGQGEALEIALPWDAQYAALEGEGLLPAAPPPGVRYSRFRFAAGRFRPSEA